MTAAEPAPGSSGPPRDLAELTSARGLAASMVVLYHLGSHTRLFEPESGFAVAGHLAVDFFFVLSGFVLAHVYGEAWASGRYAHRDFLLRRLARIWPLHFVCLLGVAAIVAAGAVAGFAPPWAASPESFLAYAALLNAVGLIGETVWNQPSWSVGAEWTAYLCFPAYLAVASALRSTAAKLVAALAFACGLQLCVSIVSGEELFVLTDAGALRIIPSFFAGVVLRQIFGTGAGASVPRAQLGRLTIETIVVMALAIGIGADPLLLWPGLLLLVYLLALRSLNRSGGPMQSRPLIWYGEISYALYLVHAPILMVAFGVGGKLLGAKGLAVELAIAVAAAMVAIVAAACAHVAVERPAQRLILALGKRGVRAATKTPGQVGS